MVISGPVPNAGRREGDDPYISGQQRPSAAYPIRADACCHAADYVARVGELSGNSGLLDSGGWDRCAPLTSNCIPTGWPARTRCGIAAKLWNTPAFSRNTGF